MNKDIFYAVHLLGPVCLMTMSKWRQMIKETKLLTEVPASGEISFFQLVDIKGPLSTSEERIGTKGKNRLCKDKKTQK